MTAEPPKQFTPKLVRELVAEVNHAAAAKQDQFTFHGQTVLTAYGYYLAVHLLAHFSMPHTAQRHPIQITLK